MHFVNCLIKNWRGRVQTDTFKHNRKQAGRVVILINPDVIVILCSFKNQENGLFSFGFHYRFLHSSRFCDDSDWNLRD